MKESKENEQVRIKTSITGRARIVAQALYGESLPEYVERILTEALARDFPAAAKRINDLASQEKASDEPKSGRRKR